MGQMELFRGHFYNWYDTLDLHPLEPKYVSTVDSGNLAGHLLTLGKQLPGVEGEIIRAGPHLLADCTIQCRLCAKGLPRSPISHARIIVTRKQLGNAVDEMMASLEPLPARFHGLGDPLQGVEAHAQTIADIAQALEQEQGGDLESELRTWAEAFKACVESHARDSQILIPWARLDSKSCHSGLAKALREHAPEVDGDRTVSPHHPQACRCAGQIRLCSERAFRAARYFGGSSSRRTGDDRSNRSTGRSMRLSRVRKPPHLLAAFPS
jgi:hypothetical protein